MWLIIQKLREKLDTVFLCQLGYRRVQIEHHESSLLPGDLARRLLPRPWLRLVNAVAPSPRSSFGDP